MWHLGKYADNLQYISAALPAAGVFVSFGMGFGKVQQKAKPAEDEKAIDKAI